MMQNPPRQCSVEILGNVVRAERRVVLTPYADGERVKPNTLKTLYTACESIVYRQSSFWFLSPSNTSLMLASGKNGNTISERTFNLNVSFVMYCPDSPCFETNRHIACVL